MCQVCINPDPVKSEKFAGELLSIINHGATALMISIGHRTCLFDVMLGMPFASSQEIAGVAGLNERYVREWLAAMAVANIIEVEPSGKYFRLPDEHAAYLTRAAAADNIAVFTQYISVLGFVEDRIVDCFRNGGGVAYEEFNRFHQVMAEDSGQSVLSSLYDHVLPLVPGIVQKLEKGISVLDIGCGRGKAMISMAKQFPKSQFTGYDLCLEPIMEAQREVELLGLKNIRFEQKDLTYFESDKQWDFITAFDAIHDQARPDKVLKGIHQALKPGGYFLMQDIDASSNVANNREHPMGPLLYTVSTMHCMTVSLAGNGMGLGTMWGTEQAQQMLQQAGFPDTSIHRLKHDIQNCYYVIRK
jgi:2-polyprenyl-3-methyl-5-hydroxy-6-metoxy-1,4-benzoquinol methylase